jgi:hypothetical protein
MRQTGGRHPGRRARRIKDYRTRIEAMGGIVGAGAMCPPELEEWFLQRVLACELEQHRPLMEHVTEAGITVVAPDQIDDSVLPAKLGELIAVLGDLRVHLRSTDHLSDRELYSYLWNEILQEPIAISGDPHSAWHFDVIGSGSEEDLTVYLRYYANVDERSYYAVEFPELTIPEPEPLPYDRDRHLPRAP